VSCKHKERLPYNPEVVHTARFYCADCYKDIGDDFLEVLERAENAEALANKYKEALRWWDAHVPETAFVNTTNVKCPNLKRRDEMPRWLIELICERCCDGREYHNLVITMFSWYVHEGRKFWGQVNDWQEGIGELPERPSK
jgi:hypothetical protein